MRIAIALSLFGALSLAVWIALWFRAAEAPSATPKNEGHAALHAFESDNAPAIVIDLAARYGGRLELTDPRRALPAWAQKDARDAQRAYDAMRTCDRSTSPLADADLARAVEWHHAVCHGDVAAEDAMVASAPFLHPSGRSYARLAIDRTPRPSDAWIREHARSFHVLELADVRESLADPIDRALASLPASVWTAILAGDAVAMTRAWVVHVDRDSFGPVRLLLRPRDAWNVHASRTGIVLRPLGPSCAEPASSALCFERLPAAARYRTTLRTGAAISAAILLSGVAWIALAYLRLRRAAEEERVFLLRTLTHELRTPATSLRLDIEPLRARFDDLPESAQEPVLRVAEGIERISRVLEVTGRALALFESPRTKRGRAPVKIEELPSIAEWMRDLTEEWPEDTALDLPAEDHAFCTDPSWLRLAIRNLVDNAHKHGRAPVTVSARATDRTLVVRVADAGKTADLSLARAAPFRRGPKSQGLGLGLSIAQRIAELLGGRLRHEPDPTTFELTIPMQKKRAEKSS